MGVMLELRVRKGLGVAEEEPLLVPPAPAAPRREAEPERDLLPVPL